MTMYWIYDLPNWQLGVLIVSVLVTVSIAGLLVTRRWTRRFVGASSENNDLINYFFAAVGVFYGLAMGLIAVATWEDFTGVDSQISNEAAALAALYRDLDGYPEPLRSALETGLRDYTRFIVEHDWPAHRRGEINREGSRVLERFENDVVQFEPVRERDKIIHAEVLRSLSTVVQQRDLRLQAVGTGLSASIWHVVIIGAVLTIGLTYLFQTATLRLHVLLVGALSTFIGLLIFLTAAMDNPFRGQFSVKPDAFRDVLEQVMTPASTSSPGR